MAIVVVVVVVVVRAPGRVDGEEEVVGAQAVALGVGVGEDARLQQLKKKKVTRLNLQKI